MPENPANPSRSYSLKAIRRAVSTLAVAAIAVTASAALAKPKHSAFLQKPEATTTKPDETCEALTQKAVGKVELVRASQKAAMESHKKAPATLMRLIDRLTNPQAEPETTADINARKVRQQAVEANGVLKVNGCQMIDIDQQLRDGPPSGWTPAAKTLQAPERNDAVNEILKDYTKNN
jgi:hypothetical protein